MSRWVFDLVVGGPLLLLGACSGSTSNNPMPPPNAGTAVIHARWTAGACNAAGRCAEQGVMGNSVIVLLRLGSGQRLTGRTDDQGDATFRITPGRYEARFARPYACGAGATTARIRVTARASSHAAIICVAP